MNDFLDVIIGESGLSESDGINFKLAVEEAVVNIISYAYPKEKKKEIDITVTYDTNRIKTVITDTGIAFDPTAKQAPDTSLPLEERPIGGLGTFLLKQLMTDVSYRRTGNKNVLTMIKDID